MLAEVVLEILCELQRPLWYNECGSDISSIRYYSIH